MQRPALPPAFAELKSMPYALFSNDAKLSKAYPSRSGCLEGRAQDWVSGEPPPN